MRVAALLPAATDIITALGAGHQLVAVTHACTLPARLAHLPRVTRSRVASLGAADVDARVSELSGAGAPLFELDENLLAGARPDVILTQAVCDVCAVREEDARAVASRLRPPPKLITLGGRTVDGILGDIAAVGAALDIEDTEELVMGLRSRMAAVHRKLKAARAPRPRVLVLEWTEPPFNAGHWVPDMVHRAGGQEVLGQTGDVSRRVTIEASRAADPEVVIVAPCGYSLREATAEAAALISHPDWHWLHSRPVWAVDANALTSTPGPGVVHGIEVLSSILHPTLFAPPSSSLAVRV